MSGYRVIGRKSIKMFKVYAIKPKAISKIERKK